MISKAQLSEQRSYSIFSGPIYSESINVKNSYDGQTKLCPIGLKIWRYTPFKDCAPKKHYFLSYLRDSQRSRTMKILKSHFRFQNWGNGKVEKFRQIITLCIGNRSYQLTSAGPSARGWHIGWLEFYHTLRKTLPFWFLVWNWPYQSKAKFW